MRIATPWIYSPKFDLSAIIGPPVVITAIVLAFGNQIAAISETPTWLWILLVLGIDVAHVYSSLFRTYFDKDEFQRRKKLYLIVPAVCWLGGIAIYALAGAGFFWGCVAYFAIYHFVRQQYGFLMLYRRGEPVGNLEYRIDQIAIYMATLYPLVYWHTYTRNLKWFDQASVRQISTVWPEYLCRILYIVVLTAFLLKEVVRWRRTGTLEGAAPATADRSDFLDDAGRVFSGAARAVRERVARVARDDRGDDRRVAALPARCVEAREEFF